MKEKIYEAKPILEGEAEELKDIFKRNGFLKKGLVHGQLVVTDDGMPYIVNHLNSDTEGFYSIGDYVAVDESTINEIEYNEVKK
ncbi:hypothetical protein [Oenococcus sicerae]|uniref:Uncharacterized protein n=1 Tax=Oenococcus sicerae TaxID=2203724 RepID=A0AAJ1R881_9LACO|nr:hypothetical protein [Oenococcus sicerae]MDN6899552.1 hypothetical protein [Oenococcus sicerae]